MGTAPLAPVAGDACWANITVTSPVVVPAGNEIVLVVLLVELPVLVERKAIAMPYDSYPTRVAAKLAKVVSGVVGPTRASVSPCAKGMVVPPVEAKVAT